MLKLAPSILSADLARLGEEILTVVEAGADYIHIDVMDGNFVPSISFGLPLIASARKITNAVFDVHLMVEEPERLVRDFADAGADIITVHAEACRHLDRTLQSIRQCRLKAGVVLNPATSLSTLDYVLNQVDMVLLMTVNPGFGGQRYIEGMTEKIRRLRGIIEEESLNVDIEVDGGIGLLNVRNVIESGANVIVAGTSVFQGDSRRNVTEFKKIFEEYGNDIPMDFRVKWD